jgi:hypothetical protein
MMRLLVFTLLCLAIVVMVSPAGTVPLAVGPLDQEEPDIYGNYVVYRDFRYAGSHGAAVVVCDLTTGSKTIINSSWNADNRPAVGENRVLWCEWKDGQRAIVSSVIGSGAEDVIVGDDGSSWGLDVNDRWAIWYRFDEDHIAGLWVYRFADARMGMLEATRGIYDVDMHIDHSSDRALIKNYDGSYSAIDLDSGAAASCSESEYNASLHSYYNGWHVWDAQGQDPADGRDVYISHAPEPSTLAAFLVGLAALGLARMPLRHKRR